MYLIWVRGLRGPEPQKCIELPRDMNGKELAHIVKRQLLPHEFACSLTYLAQLYPAPEV